MSSRITIAEVEELVEPGEKSIPINFDNNNWCVRAARRRSGRPKGNLI